MGVLDELEQAVREVAERVGPSVVGIGRGQGRGSGVVLADGLVATNAHNLRGEETTVVFGDRGAVGRVAGVDVDADLAVIAVDTGGAPAVAWATDAQARVGAAVFALANPGGQL
ncbi:MAG TPA: trypsin-like peptidase domain-containing protein, partial [Actinomycetota bacterium]|nr:trypsin-like peptidase domain-containing protein [Actinomycetota bacterium]